ncbi:MAG: hypothetical protein RL385_2481 [Pseudomonadota bacterium]|jgi:hypothetical protein
MRLQLITGLALLILTCVVFTGAPAWADAVSGTTTGTLALRGNYYLERSTRVVAPAVSARIDTAQGVRVEGTYLVDAITSASQATGVASDVGFTEIRNDAQVGAGYEFDLGGAQLDVGLRGRMSKEPDYFSRGGGLTAALSLFERTTVLRFNGYFLHDDVARVERSAPANEPNKLVANHAVNVGTLNALSLGFALDRVLSRSTTLTVGFDEGLLYGFTSNAYRKVAYADGGGNPENHPRSRARHALYAQAAHFFAGTRTAIRAGYRIYKDSWDILAHATELRIHQELSQAHELRLRYRYYRQSSAYFYRAGRNVRTDEYITADPKMRPFHDHTIGGQVRLGLTALELSALSRLATASLDFSFDYIFSSNPGYRRGLMAQAGMVWPF